MSKELSFLDDDRISSDEENPCSQRICPTPKAPETPPYPQLSSFQNPSPHTSSNLPSEKSVALTWSLPSSSTSILPEPHNSKHSTLYIETCNRCIFPTTSGSSQYSCSSSASSCASHSSHNISSLSEIAVGTRTILSQIQLTLADLCSTQKKILQDLATLKAERHLSAEERVQQDFSIADMFRALPLSTSVEFDELENQLDGQMAKQFVRLLISVGGKDLQQAINSMLRRTMVDNLAKQFSFSGKPMAGSCKIAFCKTKLSKCILVAVQKLFGPLEATEIKYCMLVSKWLQQAKTRVDRRGKKNSSITNNSSAVEEETTQQL